MTKSLFKKNDYNNNNGMSTTVWGPLIWTSLHIISFNYPVNPTQREKSHYKKWLLSYAHVLPCSYCRNNFKKNLAYTKFNDDVFTNRDTFSRFIYNLHNCVNIMLGKSVYLTFTEVRSTYENFRSRCSEVEQIHEMKEKKMKTEKKCDGSLYGTKSKSIIRIVPKSNKTKGFSVNTKCKAKLTKK